MSSDAHDPNLPVNTPTPDEVLTPLNSSEAAADEAALSAASGDEADLSEQGEANGGDSAAEQQRKRRLLIGSQRDPAAYRLKPKVSMENLPIKALAKPPEEKSQGERGPQRQGQKQYGSRQQGRRPTEYRPAAPVSPGRDAEARSQPPVEPGVVAAEAVAAPMPAEPPASLAQAALPEPVVSAAPVAAAIEAPAPNPVRPSPQVGRAAAPPRVEELLAEEAEELSLDADLPEAVDYVPGRSGPKKFPPPNIRAQLSDDLANEFEEALSGASMDELMSVGDSISAQAALDTETKYTGRVIAVRREDVFLELGGREQGIVPLLQFPKAPEPGESVEVRVVRFNAEEGLYDLALPHSAAEIGDWSDLAEGMVVAARVTGHNAGGLECEVNKIRGFIPVSQVALFRVEQLEDFVGQSFTCLVTEANPQRRNLVLSRRALLEREREEARKLTWESLASGQVREGVVRKLMDFGAFVELGDGVDGLLHVSQLGWGRVKHPRDVLEEGQHIKVRVDKIDPETRRISLSYRDLMENPWADADKKYPAHATVRGRVTRLMEFGAFVELEPGVEGLVHISELSNKRVWRVSDVVKEGDEIDAAVLSVDTASRRISLSMKNLLPPEEPKAAGDKDAEEPAAAPRKQPKPAGPLLGGLGRSTGGDRFGLRW